MNTFLEKILFNRILVLFLLTFVTEGFTSSTCNIPIDENEQLACQIVFHQNRDTPDIVILRRDSIIQQIQLRSDDGLLLSSDDDLCKQYEIELTDYNFDESKDIGFVVGFEDNRNVIIECWTFNAGRYEYFGTFSGLKVDSLKRVLWENVRNPRTLYYRRIQHMIKNGKKMGACIETFTFNEQTNMIEVSDSCDGSTKMIPMNSEVIDSVSQAIEHKHAQALKIYQRTPTLAVNKLKTIFDQYAVRYMADLSNDRAKLIEYMNDYGYFLQEAEQNSEALKILYQTIDIDPSRIVAYLNLADALAADGNEKRAKRYYCYYKDEMKNAGKGKQIPSRVKTHCP